MWNKKRKLPKRALSLTLAAVLLGGGGFAALRLLGGSVGATGIVTDTVSRGDVRSTVTGTGASTAQNAATLSLPAGGGRVLTVTAKEGDRVEKGAPLYTLDGTEAEKGIAEAKKGVETAQKSVATAQESLAAAQKRANELNKELQKLIASTAELTLTAPFDGKLTDVADLIPGTPITKGQKLAALVNTKKLKLSLYYSYAYEDSIHIGQAATVSLPAVMSTLTGVVSELHKVEYVTAEGSMCFEVVITLDNPGTLAAGIEATASITDGATPIYPYKSAKLAYQEIRELTAKAGGPLEKNALRDYAAVKQGQVLLVLGSDELDQQIEEKRGALTSAAESLDSARTGVSTALESLSAAQEKLDKAIKVRAELNVTAPIAGTVLSLSLEEGEQFESGRVAATVADTSVMRIEAQIDERNVGKVKTGMACSVTQRGMGGEAQTYEGVVESVSLTGKSENGVSYFPAVIRVENAEGTMMTGMSVDYSLTVAEAPDCLTVPVQAVQYTEQGNCLFVKADRRPENAVDLGEGAVIPKGFYAVPVEVGLSDHTNVEIKSGVEEGMEIFTQTASDSGSSFDDFGGGMLLG